MNLYETSEVRKFRANRAVSRTSDSSAVCNCGCRRLCYSYFADPLNPICLSQPAHIRLGYTCLSAPVSSVDRCS